jgi:pyruvate dehydrogenase E2 component (dihydrolipoamide acetyltransferase)
MPNVPGEFVKRASSWRKLAPLVWGKPNDSTIYGILDVDVSKALPYLERKAAETGCKLTLTHLVTRALALTFKRHPECNAYVRLGRIYQRRDVDLFVLVASTDAAAPAAADMSTDLSGVRIARADELNLVDLARELHGSAKGIRTGAKDAVAPLKRALRAFPSFLARLGLRLVTYLQYELNLNLSRFGVPRDTFGGAIVSSMGMLGIRYGFAPLVPAMRLSCLIGVGRVEERAVVVDGSIVIRPILPLTATLDHRVIDGAQAGRLAATLTQLLGDPEAAGL